MTCDEQLVARVRQVLASRCEWREMRMFGGISFTIGGHMCCGVTHDDLVLRLGKEGAAAALDEPGARPMDFTGRPLGGMVYVGKEHLRGKDLASWVGRAIDFVSALPPKPPKPTADKRTKKGAAQEKAAQKKAVTQKTAKNKAGKKIPSSTFPPRPKPSRRTKR